MNIKTYLAEKKELVEQALVKFLPAAPVALADHFKAIQYSLFAGGKRIRPILCIAAAESVNGYDDTVIPVACALEAIHTYSLIHDDLPAMDNDDLRRGKPTNHKVFGEAEAILAGDSLLTLAFDLLSNPQYGKNKYDSRRMQAIFIIARACGPLGMVGGQSLDIASEGQDIDFETLRTIHSCKTGALITASIQAGAIVGSASDSELAALTEYGNKIGLAFQIVDDLLNVTSTTEQLGKAAGSDAERQKATYPAFLGIEETRLKAKETVNAAIDALSEFDEQADPLRNIAQYIYTRSN